MKHNPPIVPSICVALLAAVFGFAPMTTNAQDNPPLNLARDGFFYIGGKPTKIDGKTFIAGQMYVEYRIPAKQTHPYPIIIVHGGTRSGANWTGTSDGREGWAQYFARRGYAVYVVDQPGRGRSAYVPEVYGPPRLANAESAQQRYLQQAKYKLWPQAHLHSQWPGTGEIDDPASQQILGSFLPEIAFPKSVAITHAAMVQLIDRIGPSIMLVHSQGGPMGWLAADARPDLVRAIVAVEPNGPPGRTVRFVGAPDWFKDGGRGAAVRADAAADHVLAAGQGPVRDQMGEGGQAGLARSRHLLEAGRAGAATPEPAAHADRARSPRRRRITPPTTTASSSS